MYDPEGYFSYSVGGPNDSPGSGSTYTYTNSDGSRSNYGCSSCGSSSPGSSSYQAPAGNATPAVRTPPLVLAAAAIPGASPFALNWPSWPSWLPSPWKIGNGIVDGASATPIGRAIVIGVNALAYSEGLNKGEQQELDKRNIRNAETLNVNGAQDPKGADNNDKAAPVTVRPPVNPNSPPPDNAYDPSGPKAPGRPSEAEGFEPPKGGDKWVENPNGRGYGWLGSDGRVWVPTGPVDPSKGISHGGPHWDVQTGGRRPSYENIFPVRP
jgi:hypothetical protein